MAYDPAQIEPKWQKYWDDHKSFRAFEPGSPEAEGKQKYYVLDMFPYPSGNGLHVGHPEGYTATDIVSRYKRMTGHNVLHPMGWDSFGLPAENHAVKTGTHPAITTTKNIANFKRQLKMLGFSYDWDREVTTSSPEYYRWTQWIFGLLYKKGLAYEGEMAVNWCPALGTVLANEEVKDGKYVETGDPAGALADLLTVSASESSLDESQLDRLGRSQIRASLMIGQIDAAFDIARKLLGPAPGRSISPTDDRIIDEFLNTAKRLRQENRKEAVAKVASGLRKLLNPAIKPEVGGQLRNLESWINGSATTAQTLPKDNGPAVDEVAEVGDGPAAE